jgi:hypothetical protein
MNQKATSISKQGPSKGTASYLSNQLIFFTIAEHSICQPGRPFPQGLSHEISPSLAAFQRAKSRSVSARRKRMRWTLLFGKLLRTEKFHGIALGEKAARAGSTLRMSCLLMLQIGRFRFHGAGMSGPDRRHEYRFRHPNTFSERGCAGLCSLESC